MVRTGRFFFALFSLFRSSLSIGLLERPLVIGLFWSLLFRDTTTSLYIAIFFELFWLDLIPVGTFIPPHLTAATFSALALTTYFGFDHPARIMVILFASMPLAWLGTKVEGMLREREKDSYNQLLNWTRNPQEPNLPTLLVLRSLVRSFLAAWVSFFVAIMILKYAISGLLAVYPGVLSTMDVTWPYLWIAATLGGLMALRVKRAYVILGVGIALFTLFMLWPRF
ncbi:MAG: PTS sugar transporter subunit IIC [Pseudodesulfovibrio sp.]